MDSTCTKRKDWPETDTQVERTSKAKRAKWQQKDRGINSRQAQTIEPGDTGIWVSCDRGRESRAVAEFLDILDCYAERWIAGKPRTADLKDEDIESSVNSELQSLEMTRHRKPCESIRLELECMLFIRVQPPIDPDEMTRIICQDAKQHQLSRNCRYLRRLTPATLVGKATENGLKEISKTVLAPVFHNSGGVALKFAIRTAIRNHSTLTRGSIISMVADIVGKDHHVDLNYPEKLILVEVYKAICTITVINGTEYNDLKKYNLAELAADSGHIRN